MAVNNRKAAVVGCGFVGSSSAFALMQSGIFSEIVLIDVDQDRAEGEAMDIAHGVPFAPSPCQIYAGDYSDVSDAAIIVVTAGAAQKPGETRLDLVNKNVGIFKSIIPQIKDSGFDGILLIVSNPVDVLTYAALKLSGLPEAHVIGSGTVLDSARLKYMLGTKLGVDARDVHAWVVGEHGDFELPIWSSANISGVPLADFCDMIGVKDLAAVEKQVADDTKNSAYEIIKRKRATYYGIAMSVKTLCTTIMRDERAIMPISSLMVGEYGIDDVCLSMPTVVGRDGVVYRVPIPMDETEKAELAASAAALKKVIAQVDFSL